MTVNTDRPKLLCVDDEPNVLEGLARQLRRTFDMTGAVGGAAALTVLERDQDFAVVLSDMRMPGMSGAELLRRARAIAPDTVRVLLTGHTDMQAAISAVNEGNIFRFLSKPCPTPQLVDALTAAARQHALMRSEKQLLEQTLRGSVEVLLETLALSNPALFGATKRVQRITTALATALGATPSWELEVAALMSQIGAVTLPSTVVDKQRKGVPLAAAEQQMVDHLPLVAERLLAPIPRLETARAIIRYQRHRFDGAGAPASAPRGSALPLGARILKVALDADALDARGIEPRVVLATLRSDAGAYDDSVLAAFAAMCGAEPAAVREPRMVQVAELAKGMTFDDDVRTKSGMLLVARGQDITETLLLRIQNFTHGIGIREPLRVLAPVKVEAAPRSA